MQETHGKNFDFSRLVQEPRADIKTQFFFQNYAGTQSISVPETNEK